MTDGQPYPAPVQSGALPANAPESLTFRIQANTPNQVSDGRAHPVAEAVSFIGRVSGGVGDALGYGQLREIRLLAPENTCVAMASHDPLSNEPRLDGILTVGFVQPDVVSAALKDQR